MRKKLILMTLLMLAVTGPPAVAREPMYEIGAGDTLEISVWRDESLSRQVIVPPDRVISFPLIGDIDVTNLTVRDLRNEITKKLSDYVPDATVTVLILGFDSLRAYVIGKVNNPGVFPITLGTDVMQVLAMAGGLNPFAAAGKIHILRREGGENVKIPFDYKEVLKGENLKQNIMLQRGDVVVVP